MFYSFGDLIKFIRYYDVIKLKKPKIGELELELERYACRALKCLVLLHKENVEAPTRTAEWLNLRGWLTNHFHVKIPSLMLNAKAQRFRQELISKIRAINESPFSDFSRLGTRFLIRVFPGILGLITRKLRFFESCHRSEMSTSHRKSFIENLEKLDF